MSHKHHDSEHKIEIEKTMRPEEAALLFADLAGQIRETCRLEFQEGERTLVLPLKSNMFMELKAKVKKGKSKLAIELEWVSDVFDAIAGQGMNGEPEAGVTASPQGDSVGDVEDE